RPPSRRWARAPTATCASSKAWLSAFFRSVYRPGEPLRAARPRMTSHYGVGGLLPVLGQNRLTRLADVRPVLLQALQNAELVRKRGAAEFEHRGLARLLIVGRALIAGKRSTLRQRRSSLRQRRRVDDHKSEQTKRKTERHPGLSSILYRFRGRIAARFVNLAAPAGAVASRLFLQACEPDHTPFCSD